MKQPAKAAYRSDLAYIHDAGFGGLPRAASVAAQNFSARTIPRRSRRRSGLRQRHLAADAVDSRLRRVGLRHLGRDVELSRRRVPAGRFVTRRF